MLKTEIKEIKDNSRSKVIPIRKVIIISFILFLISTNILISSILFYSWLNESYTTMSQMAINLNNEVLEEVKTFVQVPMQIEKANYMLFEKGMVDLENVKERQFFFVNTLNTYASQGVYSFTYGSESGEYYGARKNENNVTQIVYNNKTTGGQSWYFSVTDEMIAGELVLKAGIFDPRTRAWYLAAKESKEFTYSPIYKHFIMNDLTLSAAIPIYNKDNILQGVLGTHLILSNINDFLLNKVKASEGYVAIVEKSTGFMVANSNGMDNFKLLSDGTFNRLPIFEINNAAVLIAYNNYLAEDKELAIVTDNNKRFYSKVTEYEENGLEWLIISQIPESILIVTIQRNMLLSFSLIIIFTFVAIFLFSKVIKHYFGPIESLIQTSQKFSSGDLTLRESIKRADEIGHMAKAYNIMADTIYNQINSLENKIKERTREINDINQSLVKNQNHLQLILDSTVEAIFGIDMDGNFTFINSSGLKLLGYDSETQLIGQDMQKLIQHSNENGDPMPRSANKLYIALHKAEQTHESDDVFWRKDGTSISVEYNSYPQIVEDTIIGVVVTFLDNSERKQFQKQLFNEKEQFRATLLSVGDGVISTDKDGKILVMNQISEKLTGWKQQEAYGRPLDEVFTVFNEITREKYANPVNKVIESGEIIEFDNQTILMSKKGIKIPIEESAAPILDSEDNLIGVVIAFRDYSDKKDKLKSIEYLSYHDSLTGLYNRSYLEDAMKRLDSKRNLPFTIMMLDVNGLKLINDAFGHKMGDELLKIVAQVLHKVCREDDIIGRIGGDEFEILLPKTNKVQADRISQRIAMETESLKLDQLIVSIAVGYSVKFDHQESIEQVVIEADNQMYKHKVKHGKTMRMAMVDAILRNIANHYDQEQTHMERVSRYCEAIAREMDFSENEIQMIKTAGALHDIGKITIPPELLRKSEKLTQEEFEMIKKHAEASYQILRNVEEYSSFSEVVLYHHERWDGKGYPIGLKADSIPLISRIIAVADYYESLTAIHPYKKTLVKKDAIKELKKNSGTQFDPLIVAVFIEKVLMNDASKNFEEKE